MRRWLGFAGVSLAAVAGAWASLSAWTDLGAPLHVPPWAAGGADCEMGAAAMALLPEFSAPDWTADPSAPDAATEAAVARYAPQLDRWVAASRCGLVDGDAFVATHNFTTYRVVQLLAARGRLALADSRLDAAFEDAVAVIRLGLGMQTGTLVGASAGHGLERLGWALALDVARASPDPTARVRALRPLLALSPGCVRTLRAESAWFATYTAGSVPLRDRLLLLAPVAGALGSFSGAAEAMPLDAPPAAALASLAPLGSGITHGIEVVFRQLVDDRAAHGAEVREALLLLALGG